MSDHSCDQPKLQKQPLIPIKDAIRLLLEQATPLQEMETVPLFQAYGRILAEDLTSTVQVPPADNSAMDGYAIQSRHFINDTEKTFPISQQIFAGEIGSPLQTGTVARIFTGAPIPNNADAVIMQELCQADKKQMTSSVAVPKGTNIRRAGEDIDIGDTILLRGQKLRPQDIGLAASVGISQISVYRKLRVAVFFTGDELCEPDNTLQAGQIYNSNRYTMRGMLEGLGCEVRDLGNIKDTLEDTRDAMLKAASESDLVMTSGGVSVGEADYIRIALEETGKLDMWRIRVKPGKPLAFGSINGTPFLGLPGNPVSVFATFCIFARPFILHKQGNRDTSANSFKVPANFEWLKKGFRTEYVRVKLERDASGQNSLKLFPHQGSGVLTSTSWADGLAIIEAERCISIGDLVEFIPFGELL